MITKVLSSFVNLPFCQLAVLSTCRFVNLPFCQLVVLSTDQNSEWNNLNLLSGLKQIWLKELG
jgi:hypothetical protein